MHKDIGQGVWIFWDILGYSGICVTDDWFAVTTQPREKATVDDYENDRHCKDMLKVVKYKDLWNSLGSDDKSTLH